MVETRVGGTRSVGRSGGSRVALKAKQVEEMKQGDSHLYDQLFSLNQTARSFKLAGNIEQEARFSELRQYYDTDRNQKVDCVKGYQPKLITLNGVANTSSGVPLIYIVAVQGLGLMRARLHTVNV